MDQYHEWIAKMMNPKAYENMEQSDEQENCIRRRHHRRHKHRKCRFSSDTDDDQSRQKNTDSMHPRHKTKKYRKLNKADMYSLFGPFGPFGVFGPFGPFCRSCATGATGPAGPTGATGTGGVLGFADFFALMPPDNVDTVAPGADVSFPQDGPASGSTITRTGPSTFNLSMVGTYQVFFQVSVVQAGQLVLTLNGADLVYTVAGRAAGSSQIVGIALVRTTVGNSVLTVRNPAGNAAALTITSLAGGTRPVSAHLTITQIA